MEFTFIIIGMLHILEGLLKLPKNRECVDCKSRYLFDKYEDTYSFSFSAICMIFILNAYKNFPCIFIFLNVYVVCHLGQIYLFHSFQEKIVWMFKDVHIACLWIFARLATSQVKRILKFQTMHEQDSMQSQQLVVLYTRECSSFFQFPS